MKGLDEIMADLHAEGRKADDAAAQEMIERLEARGNYIPSSELARRDYRYALLKEYRKYLSDRKAP